MRTNAHTAVNRKRPYEFNAVRQTLKIDHHQAGISACVFGNDISVMPVCLYVPMMMMIEWTGYRWSRHRGYNFHSRSIDESHTVENPHYSVFGPVIACPAPYVRTADTIFVSDSYRELERALFIKGASE